ncbi:MAG: DUF4097 domain-containing protein [Clostridia bacterium]|nr:DUF4097 domain-containing protein [Clostridia bacterium]
MKNKTGIIILLILLSIIIFSLTMFLVRYLCGGETNMIRWGRNSKNVIFNQTYTLEEIQDIDIKQDAGDIIIREAPNDNFEVIIYGNDTQDVNVNLSYEKLSIDYTRKMSFFFFNFGITKNNIIVYVPTKYAKDITIKNDFGNCEIGNFENLSIDVECDAGNVEVGKIRNTNIQCDLGGVKVEEVLNKCNISVDSGNVRIDRLSIQENSFIKVDLGNVTIDEINDIYVDAKVDLGNSTVNGSNRNSDIILKIECDCGNIKVGK